MLQIATSSFDTLKASTEPGELQADTHSPRLLFAEITTKRIRCGVIRSVGELKDAIRDYLDQHNADPKPFVWTKTAKAVLAKERRALEKLQSITGRSQPTVSEHSDVPSQALSSHVIDTVAVGATDEGLFRSCKGGGEARRRR